MEIRIPEYGMQVYEALSHEGFDAWFVGGYVRDALLRRTAHDVDIATDARWPQVKEACEATGMSTYETGVKHGTLTVVPDGGHPVEVTTFRHDGSYSDSRHPDGVTFVDDIREDLARRDSLPSASSTPSMVKRISTVASSASWVTLRYGSKRMPCASYAPAGSHPNWASLWIQPLIRPCISRRACLRMSPKSG